LFLLCRNLMAAIIVPPRTPSPKVRIRSQSFDSPSSCMSVTPIDESPCSKSTGAIVTKPLPRYGNFRREKGGIALAQILLPLHTKMSDESILSDTSSTSSSTASSPTGSEMDVDLMGDSPSPSPQFQRERPHPLTFCQSVAYDAQATAEPSSPFLYQDTSYPMYSPWLVRAVLELYDVRGLDWMSIAEPVGRIFGIATNSAEVLNILSDNGRVHNRRWWD
jgi:hypothetical protein